MGQKKKVGKQRKDKFYHLAKETGYRSRAAFKLIQLNRKFEFLQKSKVLVDLCAAPGGWMQVAVEHMPVSAVIVGVDLFPIKPVAGCISIQEDITSSRCVQLIKKELKTWKADVVLHDVAPNVGQNWLQDAYSQTCLTLSAFKLATQILRQGGYFITKVFRSKDYNSLLWVLQQFFKNVFSTKPAASRIESAEIFIVCKGYLAPAVIDPKFLDAKHVFEDIEVAGGKKQLQQLLMEVGKKKKAEGYPTGETLLYRPITAMEFISSPDYIDLLANTSEKYHCFGQDWIDKSEKTTADIRDFCKDVKVLSKKDLKALVAWRKALRDKLVQYKEIKSNDSGEVSELAQVDEGAEVEEEDDDDDDEKKLDKVIAAMKEAEGKEAKRKKKKILKERRKIHEKTNLKMIIPGDIGPTDTSGDSLFSLKTIQTKNDVEALTDGSSMPMVAEDEPELTFEEELKLHIEKNKAKRVSFNKEKEVLDSSGRFYRKVSEADEGVVGSEEEDEDEDPDISSGLGMDVANDDESDDENDEEDMEEEEFDMEEVAPISNHPLITDLDPSDKNQKRLRKAEMWFDKPIFEGLDDESDEDAELARMADSFVLKGAQVLGYKGTKGQDNSKQLKKKKEKGKANGTEDAVAGTSKRKRNDEAVEDDKNGPEVVSSKSSKKKLKLDVQGMALGSLLIQSQKTRRDLMDDGWNKYAFNDTALPDWFLQDEKKHMRKPAPVPNELVDEYKKNLMEINARPIKKVLEAKARNKKRAIRKMEKAKKKAEAILDKSDMTETEKANQIKQVYKKATSTKKKEVAYVVAKKFNTGKKSHRPAGVKGPYKVVDPRMKKDLRKTKLGGGGKGKKGGKKGKGQSRGGGGGGKRGGRKGKR